MRPTMDEALQALFGTAAPVAQRRPVSAQPSTVDIQTVKDYWQKLRSAMKAANWQEFGHQMNSIQEWIDQHSANSDSTGNSRK